MPPDDQYAPHLPDAIRRQVEEAEAMAREAGIANVPEAPPGDNSDGPQNSGENRTDLTPSEGSDSATPATAPAPGDETPESLEAWQQRYNTLQGKYNAEVPNLREQLRAQQEQISRLQQQQFAPPPAASPSVPFPASRAAAPAREVPSEDVETYGQDLIAATQRWAEARFAPVLEDYERRLMSVEGGAARLQEYTSGQAVEVALARAVPDWEQINTDQNFLAWLAQRDPFSGQVRRDLLTEAHTSGDAARTIAFFQAYKNEHTVVSQGRGTQQAQTGADALADRLPLENLAVPGRSSVATPPPLGAPERRVWRPQDITAFYDQKRRGLWDHRRDEAARLEADIVAAGTEGRVR